MVVFGEPVGSASWTGAGMCAHMCVYGYVQMRESEHVYTHIAASPMWTETSLVWRD